ncbi:MAG: O-antigen ligase family protein [Bradyrhizobium sp.]|uniref:O-antigen ligase family protein n=1 Tax=Bradyrhizobium sp. TaxID=376 RepID=UPI001C28EA9E|nr:O-antigen ligase [Bradyrhizobium sp.]MBU6461939.1 O-antigen ligase family protein [Pseudomonadota bacterium]MDE2066916.1 O-antigen ligase family protein [Bradyrhizobium sp.]MDE2241285.1 O-antigen ligase family protein [Bradyrhizobium sp.]MDE2473328.1 O-antigen ligase family protein [Bradyrhizobium sp.]
MSQFITTSDVRAVVSDLRQRQVMDVLRGATFIGVLLLAWVSLRPFIDLGNQALKDMSTGNETLTYLAFGGFAVLTLALAMRDNMPGLATLLSPGYLLFGGWILLTVLLSLDPGTSIRRFALTVCVVSVAAALMLLPKSQSELARWFSVAALILLAICYLGVLLAPNLSIHLATDTQEPHLAGDWRGSFGHKNVAAAVMAMLVFLGIYIVRSGAWLSGIAIIALSALFLIKAEGKSSTALLLIVLGLTQLTIVVRSFWGRAAMMLTPLLIMNLLSVGTVMSTGLAEIVSMLPIDPTFTGRTDIWTFAVQALQLRLPIGYGFAAFWGSSSIQNLPQGMEWAEYASHSHNGYLDTALAMGLPGLMLLIAVLVIAPLRDFHAADRDGNSGPLAMLLLQIWLFGLYLSSMESFFLDRADPMWFTFLLGVFGLHYLARFRLRE